MPCAFPIRIGSEKRQGRVPVAGGHVECAFAGKHGFARKSEFAVAEQTEDSITFTLDEKATTPDVYPYKFRLSVRHT
jgi:galactose mutarotase-like enzyme